MIVKKSESKKRANSPKCIVYEYDHGDRDVNIVIVNLSGRYPDKGRVINKTCKEIALVIEGKGKVGIENREFSISEGDSILIKPNQKFFWEGKMKLAMVCYPAFSPEQHVECD